MKKILIIEDEQAYLNLLYSTLSRKGYTIFSAVDGEQGLEKAKTHKPDLILLDIRLPGMDGIQMLEELRKIKNIKDTKVVMLTNLEPDATIVDKVVDNLPVHYFVKSDIGLNELIGKISQVFTE